MVFPVAKLVYLGVKQLSKPLSRTIKEHVKSYPFFRYYLLAKPAQYYHTWETNLKMRLLGLGKVKDVKPLTEEMAVELGADMLGEGVMLSVGVGIILAEYKRQQWKEQKHENYQNSRLEELEQSVANLTLETETQSAQIREMTRLLHTLQPKKESDKHKTTNPKRIVDDKTNIVLDVVTK